MLGSFSAMPLFPLRATPLLDRATPRRATPRRARPSPPCRTTTPLERQRAHRSLATRTLWCRPLHATPRRATPRRARSPAGPPLPPFRTAAGGRPCPAVTLLRQAGGNSRSGGFGGDVVSGAAPRIT